MVETRHKQDNHRSCVLAMFQFGRLPLDDDGLHR